MLKSIWLMLFVNICEYRLPFMSILLKNVFVAGAALKTNKVKSTLPW